MNIDSKFLESQFLNEDITEELDNINESSPLGNVVKNIIRSIKNKFNKANGKATHYKETIKKDKEKEYKPKDTNKNKMTPREVREAREELLKEIFSKTEPLINKIISRYPLVKDVLGAYKYNDYTGQMDFATFFIEGEDNMVYVAGYDIWEHPDVIANKARARVGIRNDSDAEVPSVWTDEFTDQFNHAVEDIEKEITKLGYGECELDCDWDDGYFDLYVTDKVIKEYTDKYLKDHPVNEEFIQNEELVDFLESLQNEPCSEDIKRNMQEVEDTEKYNNPTHGEDNLVNDDEDLLAVMDKVTSNVHGTLFGSCTDDSMVYAGAYDSYLADVLDNETALAKALRMECGLNESSYSILNEARIQDNVKEKWEKFVNFINRIDDRFYSAMEKILLQQKDYLEKYEDIILNKKPREDLEYEYEGDYIEGIDRCMNTPVPIFNYERDAKWLRQEGYEGAIKDFMAGKNFKYNKDEELAQQFKNWFIAAERGNTKGKFSNLNFKAMYQFCYKYQDIEAMVKKDQNALNQSTNILINAVNKALRERGESTNQDQTAKSNTNTTTAGATAANNKNAANNGGNTAATPNTTTNTTNESYWMPLEEADNNATNNQNNNGNNKPSGGLTIKTNTPNKVDANGNVKQKDVTAQGEANTTNQDMTNILNKWIAMSKALITAKLTCTQKIARDYMKLIKAHVRSYGGKGTVNKDNAEGNTTDKTNAEVSQNQQEENKTEQK